MSTKYVYENSGSYWEKLKVVEESDKFYIVETVGAEYEYEQRAVRKDKVFDKPKYKDWQLVKLLEDFYKFKGDHVRFLAVSQIKKEAISLGLLTEDEIDVN